jgi:hypothetical protein
VDALETACAALLSSLGRLAHDEISAEQFSALDALRREIEPLAADPDPLVRADREQALSSWLTCHGIVRGWIIAPPLAAAGVDLVWCTRAAAVPEGSALEPGLEWVASTFSVTTLLGEATRARAAPGRRRLFGAVPGLSAPPDLRPAWLGRIHDADVSADVARSCVALSV